MAIMIKYNLYYKNNKINRVPLSKEEIDKVYEYDKINKKLSDGSIVEIPVKKIKCVKVTLI